MYLCIQSKKRIPMKNKIRTLVLFAMCIAFTSVTIASDVGKQTVPKTNSPFAVGASDYSLNSIFTLESNVSYVPFAEGKTIYAIEKTESIVVPINLVADVTQFDWPLSCAAINILSVSNQNRNDKTSVSATIGECSNGIYSCCIIEKTINIQRC